MINHKKANSEFERFGNIGSARANKIMVIGAWWKYKISTEASQFEFLKG